MITILIKQTRINSCRYFASVPPNSPIYVRVDNVGRFERQLRAFGFQNADESGTSILPYSVNRYAKKMQSRFLPLIKVSQRKITSRRYTGQGMNGLGEEKSILLRTSRTSRNSATIGIISNRTLFTSHLFQMAIRNISYRTGYRMCLITMKS